MPAANGLESTQRSVGLKLFTGQDLPSISSPQATLFNLFPNSFPPAQSLLFRPPSSPPEKKFSFDPFSLEEDTLHLAPEPKSNQFGITYPVRSPDYKSPTNTLRLPGPPSFPTGNVHPPAPYDQKPQVYTVPYPPLFPTQTSDVLSPLSIPLLLSPLPTTPPPSDLIIKIAGPEGYLNADHHKDRITRFLLSRSTQVANSLVIVWQLSHLDSGGARGLMSLKALFAQLDEKILDSDRTALSSFTELSITIPDLVKDAAPYNDLPVEDDGIDLTNAVDLLKFTWHGDFVIFASKFKNLSFTTLTVLNMKSSHITIEDAVTLLHSCPDLDRASLGTIQGEDECEAVLLSKTSCVKKLALLRLSHLALESNVALHPLVRRILWTARISLRLTLTNQATANIHRLPLPWDLISCVELNCHLTDQELFNVKIAFPAVKYNDIGT